jgi:hypothetical protein
MKKEYDFSNATRGKFYNAEAQLNVPVYLDSEVQRFVERIARDQGSTISHVVNELLRADMKPAQDTP